MITVLVFLIGFAAGGAIMFAIARVRLTETEAELERLEASASSRLPVLAAVVEADVLTGLRIGLAIEQDHASRPFATLLKTELEKIDGVEVADVEDGSARFDIVIRGRVVGNGYSSVYYDAELTASASGGVLCTLQTKPAQGDRPSNLAIEFLALVRGKLAEQISRYERRKALRELNT